MANPNDQHDRQQNQQGRRPDQAGEGRDRSGQQQQEERGTSRQPDESKHRNQ
ncbi:hypothetical protein GRI97_11015 [Altererythrobacter xixiisoli]|uniref:Uncharacterized protein n=1 Tax=Croceibacterium xixiisoli TaxID=1476466 RepID=A0A6I4TWC6_9SPHN|nr:hypothetical protein [Croceibacterium xixiisoli]MXO99519.1 hypothetical protein [Croceibacterium xixiisoli]